MQVKILGSGAGGGFPQWNCNCNNCKGVREQSINALPRTQSSIAISENNDDWILFNASPDIRQQLIDFKEAHPKNGIRGTGIKAIVLVDSQIDHTTGLLLLRETDDLNLYMTETTQNDLTLHYPILKILEHYCTLRVNIIKDINPSSFIIPGFDNIQLIPVPLISESPPYSPNRGKQVPGSNLGFKIINTQSNQSLFYSPGLGKIDDNLFEIMQGCDTLLIDGTFWTMDEMIQNKINNKQAIDMGHLPLSGEEGLLSKLNQLDDKRKILIHINNTNPILKKDSKEAELLAQHNIEIAFDGMNFTI